MVRTLFVRRDRHAHAHTHPRWSRCHAGDKFIVTSAYKEVRVCTYDPENDWWWPSDDIKKADKSTVLAAAWHPNSQLIATGSAKKVCRVFSAYIDETDDVYVRCVGEVVGLRPANGFLRCAQARCRPVRRGRSIWHEHHRL